MRTRFGLIMGFLFCWGTNAQAVVYLSTEEALRLAFPAGEQRMTVPLSQLTDAQLAGLKEKTGMPFSSRITHCYQGLKQGKIKGYACIDNMIGKSEYITYLLYIRHPQGEVEFVELMTYRESEGGEIKNPAFLRQFQGKNSEDPVRLERDIRKISGATYSSRALATGARKLIHLYRIFLKDLPPLHQAAP